MKYSVTTNEALRELCIKNGWFTCGTNRQYEKLFYANTHGCPLEEIATIIWICSDDAMPRRDILFNLKEERVRYWQPILNIEEPRWIYRFWNRYGISMKCTFTDFCDSLYTHDWKLENLFKIELNNKTIWYYAEHE